MAAGDEVGTSDNAEGAQAPSLASTTTGPVRGILKLLVRASASQSMPSRLGAWLILLVAISIFALLGYFLPSIIASARS